MANWRKWLVAAASLLVCAMLVLAPSLADARAGGSYRSGGGSSFSSQGSLGSRTYNYNGAAPVERSITPRTPGTPPGMAPYGQPSFGAQHPFLTGLAGAFFGSWLGSLLFPHWGGYGYGMGFGGMLGSLFSWLLILGLIWWVIRMFRGGRPLTMPGMGGMGFQGMGAAQPGYGGAAAAIRSQPLSIAQADYQAFEAILKTVQGAWSKGDLARLRQYVTPEMLSYFAEELAENQSQGVENHVEQVELIRGDLREAWDEGRMQYATCHLRWRALDYTVRSDNGAVVDGDPQHPSEAAEVWTFARSPAGHWLLSAIQQV